MFQKTLSLVLVVSLACSFLRVNTEFVPAWDLWGNPEYIKLDRQTSEFVNSNTAIEQWRYADASSRERLTRPERVPARKQIRIVIVDNPLLRREPILLVSAVGASLPKRRFLLINIEQTANYELRYRTWPHLGLLFVGTAAEQVGWDVELWDELVQSHVDLSKLVQPGDVVGLSLLVTGIERGVDLAREAKELGASMVIAGNDAARFRANQLLALPGKPIDAVFTTDSLSAVRNLFRGLGDGVALESLSIPGVQTVPGARQYSNHKADLFNLERERKLLEKAGQSDHKDVFVVPNFRLYPESYLETVWGNYREVFGHKHRDSQSVRNANGLLAHGCTKGSEPCEHCVIGEVQQVLIPPAEYVARMAERYAQEGITHLFNVTDSSYEMSVVPRTLQAVGSPFKSMTIYGRSQGIARNPKLLELWQKVAPERLVLNVGMESGDERILETGVSKSHPSIHTGSRLEENREAVRRIKEAGANLHFSLIFGSPGESHDSCMRSLDFLHYAISVLGSQLDTAESDIRHLNFGDPASKVFEDYDEARNRAALAGKEITVKEWETNFAAHRNELKVPLSAQDAWYQFFANISLDEARGYNSLVDSTMEEVNGSIHGRAFQP